MWCCFEGFFGTMNSMWLRVVCELFGDPLNRFLLLPLIFHHYQLNCRKHNTAFPNDHKLTNSPWYGNPKYKVIDMRKSLYVDRRKRELRTMFSEHWNYWRDGADYQSHHGLKKTMCFIQHIFWANSIKTHNTKVDGINIMNAWCSLESSWLTPLPSNYHGS